jgi:hypothetical protein
MDTLKWEALMVMMYRIVNGLVAIPSKCFRHAFSAIYGIIRKNDNSVRNISFRLK